MTVLQPTHGQSRPAALSDVGPDTLMTRTARANSQGRLAAGSHNTSVGDDPEYVNVSSQVVDSPDYQRSVSGVPVKETPTYTALTKRDGSPHTAEGDPDYAVITE